MASNELIGIDAVLVLTFCLIALYHLIGSFGRHSKRYAPRQSEPKIPNRMLRASRQDDAWLLWSPELGEQAGTAKPGFPTTAKQGVPGNVRESR